MRNHLVLIVSGMFVCASALPAGDKDSTREAELKWVRGIVSDFFAAIEDGGRNAIGLLSPELAKEYYSETSFPLGVLFRGLPDRHILSEEMAPNGSEVVYSGNLKGWDRQGQFTLRVAKESTGRWSIRYLRVREIE